MRILKRILEASCRLTGGKYDPAKRRQFNLTISESLTDAVKIMVMQLEVPMYVVCEHLLQVGMYHMMQQVFDDPLFREKFQEHLVEGHLLGGESDEYEFLQRPDTDLTDQYGAVFMQQAREELNRILFGGDDDR